MTPKSSSRRAFLGTTSALFASAAMPTLPAEARALLATPKAARPTLVCLFLRGGNDALNTVVPYTNKLYQGLRPTIGIREEGTRTAPGVLKLTDDIGLNPALAGLEPLWKAKQLACLCNVGSPHPTRSHFDAQDFMEYAAPGQRTMKDGWLNRYLKATRTAQDTPLRAVAIQGLLPRSLRGDYPVLAVPRLDADESEGLLDLFDDVYKDLGAMEPEMERRRLEGGADEGRKAAVDVGRHTIETLRHFWEVTSRTDNSKAYPATGLARRMERIARLIKSGEGLEVAAIDVGGWDHHQGEGGSDGAIARQLKVVGDAIGAFAKDLGSHMDKTMVLVMTEFGRNVAENGTNGTDHGRGSMMLAAGGPVAGGQVYGSYGTLEPKTLENGRDLPVEIDFRQVFDETLSQLFGFQRDKDFFPIFAGRDPLGLVKKTS